MQEIFWKYFKDELNCIVINLKLTVISLSILFFKQKNDPHIV